MDLWTTILVFGSLTPAVLSAIVGSLKGTRGDGLFPRAHLELDRFHHHPVPVRREDEGAAARGDARGRRLQDGSIHQGPLPALPGPGLTGGPR